MDAALWRPDFKARSLSFKDMRNKGYEEKDILFIVEGIKANISK